jgi:hypothetical protein
MIFISFGIVILDGLRGDNWYIKFFRFILLLSYIVPIVLRGKNIYVHNCYSEFGFSKDVLFILYIFR